MLGHKKYFFVKSLALLKTTDALQTELKKNEK